MKQYMTAFVLSQDSVGKDIYSLWIKAEKVAEEAEPGQFINIYTNDSSMLLPRPISICEINAAQGTLRLVYRVAGKGTATFRSLTSGDELTILGPLGNGFPIFDKKAMVIGGGIGIPPMLELSKHLQDPVIVAGYRDEQFLKRDLEKYGKVFISSDVGLFGTRGTVLDAIRENNLSAEVIYACGPMPMLSALKKFAAEQGIKAYIALKREWHAVWVPVLDACARR